MAGLSDIFTGFVQGFDQTKRNMEEQKRRQQMDKLQAKFLELSLKDKETQQAAAEKIREMTIGRVGEIVTRGQKEIGGRQAPNLEFTGKDPMSVSQILADPEGRLAMLESRLATPKDLAPQQGKSFEKLAMLEAAGIDPKSPEGRAAVLSSIGGRGVDDATMKTIQMQIESIKLGQLQDERTQEGETKVKQIRSAQVALRNDFNASQEIIQLQKDLENTALAVGVPFGDFMRDLQSGGAAITARLGFDVGKSSALIAKRDRLNKLFAEGTIEAIGRFAGTGTIQANKFEALKAATPNLANSPVANALLLADRMQAALDGADIEGIDVAERDAIEAFIKGTRSMEATPGQPVVDVPGAAAAVGEGVEAIAQMTLQQIQSIDPQEIANWTAEQKAALDAVLKKHGF